MAAAIAFGLPPDTTGRADVVDPPVPAVAFFAAAFVAAAFVAAAFVAAAFVAAAFAAATDLVADASLVRAEAANLARCAVDRDTAAVRAVAARWTSACRAAASAAVLAVAGAFGRAETASASVVPTPIALLVEAYAVAPMDTVAMAAEVMTAGRRSSSAPLGRAVR